MVHKVLIDYNALGWAKNNTDRIRNDYEDILHVGESPHPEQGSSDAIIGSYCEEVNCDLITSDYKAYVGFLENKRIKTVQISKYAWDKEAERHIYLIKII